MFVIREIIYAHPVYHNSRFTSAEFRHLVIADTVYFKYFAHNLQIRHFRHV